MNRQQFNGRNINTINFNYRHLHRLGIRGGMEYVTFFQQDTDFGKDGNVLPIGSPDFFGPKNEKYGVLYVREGAEAQLSTTREHNNLVYIDNTGISHNLAGGTDMGYWTKKNPAPGPTGSHVINGDSGGAIRPVYGPRFAIKHAIMYNAEEKDSNPLYEDTSVWGGGAGGMQYIDSSHNTVYLKSPLIVMDKMQFLECQGESLASAGNLGTVRYTYGYGGQTGSTGCVSSGLDPSGSSFQGKILNEDGNPMWIKFGAGQTTHTQLWAERQAPGGTGCIVTTRNAPQGVGTTLEIYPADCCGNYSFAIGENCSAGYASVAAGTGNKALGDNSVAMGLDCSAIGISSIAMGDNNTATGNHSVALGVDNTATANYAVAMGMNSQATGISSTAMGNSTQATGSSSTAMGQSTQAIGSSSTAMGQGTQATRKFSTAMGNGTIASGDYSTAMGKGTSGSGDYSTAMGNGTTASGPSSTAMGDTTTAYGSCSTAMGKGTNAMGTYSTAMGWNTTACGQYSTAMGVSTIASGDYSTAMGFDCSAGGIASFADGSGCSAGKDGDIAMGWASVAGYGPYTHLQGGGSSTAWGGSGGNVAIGFNNNANSGTLGRDNGSVAIGGWCKSTGINSTAMGWNTTAYGEYSTAMGVSTIASAFASTAMGQGTTGSGEYSTAMGGSTIARGDYSTAMGNSTTASGSFSTAMGFDCSAGGIASFADGSGCTARDDYNVAFGKGANAGGTCGFMYKDACGNTFCFDSGGHDASGQLLVNGSAVRGGGGGSSSGVVGEIIAFAGPSGNSLEDWLFCDGRALSSSDGFGTYLSLYNAISTTYGNGAGGDGDFNIPDLRGRTVYGDASGAPHAANRSSVANSDNISDLSGVVGTDTMSITQMPSHNHAATDSGHQHDPGPIPGVAGQAEFLTGPGHTAGPNGIASTTWGLNVLPTTKSGQASITVGYAGGGAVQAPGPGYPFLPPAVLVNFFIRYRKESVEGSGVTPGIDVLHGTSEYNSFTSDRWAHGQTLPADTPVRVTLVGGGGAGGNCPGYGGDAATGYTYLGGPGGGGGAGSSYIYWTTAGKAGTATYVTGDGGMSNLDPGAARKATGTSSNHDDDVLRDSGGGAAGGHGPPFSSPEPLTSGVPTFSRSMLFGMAGVGGQGSAGSDAAGLPHEGDLAVPGANGMTAGGGEPAPGGGAGGFSMASTAVGGGSITWGSGGYGAGAVGAGFGAPGIRLGNPGYAGAVIFEWFGGTHAGGGGIIAKGGGHGSSLRTKANNTAQGDYSTAMGKDCSANGIASFADGSGCTAHDDYNVALGNGADASGTRGFMFKDACGNTFCFDSGGHDGSGNIKINDKVVVGVGTAGAPLGTSLFVKYSTQVPIVCEEDGVVGGLPACHPYPVSYDLSAIKITFPNLPTDARSVSVTVWNMGDDEYCGGGATFNIPSSTLRNWYWGILFSPLNAYGYNYALRLWDSEAAAAPLGTTRGFAWSKEGGGVTWVNTGTPAAFTDVKLYNVVGGVGGGGEDTSPPYAPVVTTGAGKVPGAVTPGSRQVVPDADQNAPLYILDTGNAGIKVQWIE